MPRLYFNEKLGRMAFRDKKIEEAVSLLEEAIRLNPSYADALESLGVLYANVGRLDPAAQPRHRMQRAHEPPANCFVSRFRNRVSPRREI